MSIHEDSPALGPACTCSTVQYVDGRYSADCPVHARYRCIFCDYVALQGGLCERCVRYERWRK